MQPGFGNGGSVSPSRARQASGSLPWIGVDYTSEFQRLQAEHAVRQHETANFQHGGPEKHTGAQDPQHALQKNGGLADPCMVHGRW